MKPLVLVLSIMAFVYVAYVAGQTSPQDAAMAFEQNRFHNNPERALDFVCAQAKEKTAQWLESQYNVGKQYGIEFINTRGLKAEVKEHFTKDNMTVVRIYGNIVRHYKDGKQEEDVVDHKWVLLKEKYGDWKVCFIYKGAVEG